MARSVDEFLDPTEHASLDHSGIISTGMQGRANSGGFTAVRKKINFIQSGTVSIAVVDDGGDGEIEVTISASSGTPPLITGSTASNGAVGAGGSSANLGSYDAVAGGWCGAGSSGTDSYQSSFAGVPAGMNHASLREVSGVTLPANGSGAVFNVGGAPSAPCTSSTNMTIGPWNGPFTASYCFVGLF